MLNPPAIDPETGAFNLAAYFGNDTLSSIIFTDYKAWYLDDHQSRTIMDYRKKAAELILGNIYDETFQTEGKSLAEIQRGGVELFKERVRNSYTYDATIPADLKLKTAAGERDVYVVFVDRGKLPTPQRSKQAANTVPKYDESGATVLQRVNQHGEIMYSLPQRSTLVVEEDHDVVYVELLNPQRKTQDKKVVLDMDKVQQNKRIVGQFLDSFESEIEAVVPMLAGSGIHNTLVVNLFKKYSGYYGPKVDELNADYLKTHFNQIVDVVANRAYTSWLKSHEFIAARIPAQSMQSFMEMKNVAYYKTKSNEAYVSVFQIFIQGSDFDIDKAYLMGYGFNRAGHYEV